MSFVEGPVTVEVPATSANLGPGFDCLGLALDLHDRLTGEVIDSGLEIVVRGEGEGEVPLDEHHLVVRSMRAAFEALGEQPLGLRLECDNVIPHSRGLGSSSAAIVGGLGLARALVADGASRLDDAALLALANEIEGHPDNVAPALYGGVVIAGQAGDDVWAHRFSAAASISAVVFVPAVGVRTDVARGLLPNSVTHADAAANTGRAALLVAALGGATEHLLRGTEDFLHQRPRGAAMPHSLALVERLRADGHPAVISGAGPTVLAFLVGGEGDVTGESGAGAVLASYLPAGWAGHTLAVDERGLRTV